MANEKTSLLPLKTREDKFSKGLKLCCNNKTLDFILMDEEDLVINLGISGCSSRGDYDLVI